MIIVIITALIALIVGAAAFFGQLHNLAFIAGFIKGKLGRYGKRVLYAIFFILCLMTISLALIVSGITNDNALASGIGSLIAITLFLLTWTPIGLINGLFGTSKEFGSRIFPIAIRAITFWSTCIGLLAMTIPNILADQMATATVTQKFTVIVGATLVALMMATFSWSTGKSITAFMKAAMAIVFILSALVGVRYIAKDRFDSQVALLVSSNIQAASTNFEKADQKQTVFSTFKVQTTRAYQIDSVIDGKVKTYTPKPEAIFIAKGQRVQVLNSARPIICDGVALIKIKLPDATNNLAQGKSCWVEADRLKEGETAVVPDQYAVTQKSDLLYKVGIGGKETRRIVFDADSIMLEDLPVGKSWILSGAAYGDVSYHDPKTGELRQYMFNYRSEDDCPASLEMIGKKGMVIFITFS